MMRTLIIDDEPVSRRVLKRLLSRFPEIEVQEAADGEAGWTALADPLPAMILCDLSMPRMDGTTLIRKIRDHQLFASIPIIVISAANDRDTVVGLKDLRILDYLLKPFDLVQTFARLERHLNPLLVEHRRRKDTVPSAAQAARPAGAATKAAAEPVPAAESTAPEPAPVPATDPVAPSATA